MRLISLELAGLACVSPLLGILLRYESKTRTCGCCGTNDAGLPNWNDGGSASSKAKLKVV